MLKIVRSKGVQIVLGKYGPVNTVYVTSYIPVDNHNISRGLLSPDSLHAG